MEGRMKFTKLLLLFISMILFSPMHSVWAADKTASPVCTYIVDAYNKHREKDIFISLNKPVDIYNNGNPVEVELIFEGNHGGFSLGADKDPDGRPAYAKGYDAGGLWKLDDIHIVFFKGRYFVVAEQDEGPIDVTDLSKGDVCRFRWIWTASIEEDHDHKLCERVAKEERFSKIDFSVPSSEAIPDQKTHDDKIAVLDYGEMLLGHVAFVNLDNSGNRISVGELTKMLPGGIENIWLTLLKDGEVSSDNQNLDLLKLQNDFMENDWGASVFPVHIDSNNYIEADHPDHYNQLTPSRELWRLLDNKVETICRISETVRYEPAPAYYDMAPREGAIELFTLSVGETNRLLEEEKEKALEQEDTSK